MISSGSWSEGSLTGDQLAKLGPDQVNQLYELMKETQKYKDGDDEE